MSTSQLSISTLITNSLSTLITNSLSTRITNSLSTRITNSLSRSRAVNSLSAVIGLCTMMLTNSVTANDYMVEVLIFENTNASTATESHAYEAPKKMKSESNAWLIEPTMLIEDAILLEQSPDYLLKQHYSWGIESLPYQQSANYTIVEAESQGYIKVYAGQLLFTNIDIDYKGFRMKEKRRLKLNEKHFFDHPKFGILMQVSRLPETPEESDLEQIEP
jgi:hypothetical protein